MDLVRRDSMMRALDLRALANGFRGRLRVENDPTRRKQLQALFDFWEGRAREAEDEGPVRARPKVSSA